MRNEETKCVMSEGGQVPAGPDMAGFLPARAQVLYQPLFLPSLLHTPDLGTNHPGSSTGFLP